MTSYITDLISVIIPTFERFEHVQVAINSVITQTYKKFEVIVVDDCSKDPRYKELDYIYKDRSNVKIIHLPQNLREKYKVSSAQGETRNEGIKVAQGEYLAFLDDDDAYISPNKLELQLSYMKKYSYAGFICSNMYVGSGIYKGNTDNSRLYFNSDFDAKTLEPNVYLFDSHLISKDNYINNSTTLVRRKIFDMAGGLKIESCEDYQCWIRMLKHGVAIYLSTPLVYYDLTHGSGKNYVYT